MRWHVRMGPHRFTVEATDLTTAEQELKRRLEALQLERGPVIAWHEVDAHGNVGVIPAMVDEIHHHAPGELEARLAELVAGDQAEDLERFDGPACAMCGAGDGHPCDCFDSQQERPPCR